MLYLISNLDPEVILIPLRRFPFLQIYRHLLYFQLHDVSGPRKYHDISYIPGTLMYLEFINTFSLADRSCLTVGLRCSHDLWQLRELYHRGFTESPRHDQLEYPATNFTIN